MNKDKTEESLKRIEKKLEELEKKMNTQPTIILQPPIQILPQPQPVSPIYPTGPYQPIYPYWYYQPYINIPTIWTNGQSQMASVTTTNSNEYIVAQSNITQ